MFIAAGLLQKDHLVDAGVPEALDVLADVVGGADAVGVAGGGLGGGNDLVVACGARLLEVCEQAGAPRIHIVRYQGVDGIGKELEPFLPTPDRRLPIRMDREVRDHGEVGVHGMPDGHALIGFDDPIIDLRPGLGLFWIEEREGQGTDTDRGGDLDGVAVGAGHPHRRVRALHRLRHDVAAGEGKALALVAGVRVHHHHVGDLLGRLDGQSALLAGRNAEAAQLQPRGSLADPEIQPAAGDDVQRGQTLGRAGRVVVVGDHLPDAVTDADGLGEGCAGGQEHLGCGGMRILLEEVVLHLPSVVVAQPVGQHDLLQGVMEKLRLVAGVPRFGQLVLVENPETHGDWLPGCGARSALGDTFGANTPGWQGR